jgi:hypothetical protein
MLKSIVDIRGGSTMLGLRATGIEVISRIVANESRLSEMLKSIVDKVDMGGGLTMLELRVTGIEVMSYWN